jgi:hypothetical protein
MYLVRIEEVQPCDRQTRLHARTHTHIDGVALQVLAELID